MNDASEIDNLFSSQASGRKVNQTDMIYLLKMSKVLPPYLKELKEYFNDVRQSTTRAVSHAADLIA